MTTSKPKQTHHVGKLKLRTSNIAVFKRFVSFANYSERFIRQYSTIFILYFHRLLQTHVGYCRKYTRANSMMTLYDDNDDDDDK